jgi:hypothetical protein
MDSDVQVNHENPDRSDALRKHTNTRPNTKRNDGG